MPAFNTPSECVNIRHACRKQIQKCRAQGEQMNQSINKGMEGRRGGGTQEGQWGPESHKEVLGFSTGIGEM